MLETTTSTESSTAPTGDYGALRAALKISIARLRMCRNDAAARGLINEAENINSTILAAKEALSPAEGL